MPEGIEESLPLPEDGEPSEHESEDVEEDKSQGETGRGNANDAPSDDGAINPASCAACRPDPQGHTDTDRNDKGHERERCRQTDASGEDVRDGGRRAHRIPKIASERAGEPVPITNKEGLVEAVFLRNGSTNLGGEAAGANQDLHRISRDHVQEGEDDERQG